MNCPLLRSKTAQRIALYRTCGNAIADPKDWEAAQVPLWAAPAGLRRPIIRLTRLGFLPAPDRFPPRCFLIGVESPAWGISDVAGTGITC